MGFKVGKIFKKVLKTTIKVAPYVLAAAAIVYTGGAAMGATWATGAGGFQGAVASLVARTGATGTFASILSGGIAKASIGAALGIGGAAITGQSITKGAQFGALSGAVVGGVMGAMNPAIGVPPAAASPASAGLTTPVTSAPLGAPGNIAGAPLTGELAVSGADAAALNGAATSAPGYVGQNVVGGVGSFMNQPAAQAPLTVAEQQAAGASQWYNSPWTAAAGSAVGGAISGIGTGISGSAQAAAARDVAETERFAIRDNYANPTGAGLLTPQSLAYIQNQPLRQTPAERFGATRLGRTYKWNPQAGQIEEVSIA